ncbi:DUF2628 domain-containing protein [Mycolicibacterium flavescens]|uniref:DUF2628 domain-containing protein n=1 Tax=Mycolicibacterium flavescens TaxID=1776 RepID=A0A1E3RM08_MYCFV|nr:DUF2628 domain-containing protein [Mycolicibacterium flavescens]MCV7281720.1 DUF2628 domain-containing protein [Mycolicibacterium flavescens]ODQ90880.1 hypothetical protein BHQ18_09215 [Mycolicibacterium flavescens]
MSQNYEDFARSWQQRFTFYDHYGVPNTSPESREAYKQLSFMDKLRLTNNIWGLLFGPIYFFVKGMWRKGLVLLGAVVVLATIAIGLDVPDIIDRALSLIVPVFAMTTANYAYYLHAVKGDRSWNVFEGLRRS